MPVPRDSISWRAKLFQFAPGLPALWPYNRSNLSHDLVAGLSVAAVALPVGVAYAQLAGFNPSVGLYSSILPLVAYAVFGTSRQLIMGPDAATCALIATAVAPLAKGNPQDYESLSVTLCFLAGILCIGASFLRLGVLADFLSKPILVGFLNGIALSVILGQIGKIFGFAIDRGGIVPRLLEFVSKLGQTHWPTLAVGVGTFVVLLGTPKLLKRVPAALVAIVLSALVVRFFGLEHLGVKIVGSVPAGLPHLHFPRFPIALITPLLGDAAGLALVTFSSMMLTSRSFAARNRYDVDADREFAALGMANIASAFSQGFAISGADSRTAMNDASGGRTQVTGLVAAGSIAVVLLFFTGPLRFVPIAALGAVLVKAGFSLIDLKALKLIFRIDRREFALSILATLGVVVIGAIQAILFVVILATIRFVRLVARPKIELLGKVEGMPGYHALDRHPQASTIPGLLVVRFNAPIVFFNAPYFKRGVLETVNAAATPPKWIVLDMIPITMIDATGLETAQELADELRSRGITLAAAGRKAEWNQWANSRHFGEDTRAVKAYPTLKSAIRACLSGEQLSTGEAEV
ncbi:MAG: SulP family inorganic anion transporter [Candidatus Acidiferrum sp.]